MVNPSGGTLTLGLSSKAKGSRIAAVPAAAFANKGLAMSVTVPEVFGLSARRVNDQAIR
jgi:hypothetical protein